MATQNKPAEVAPESIAEAEWLTLAQAVAADPESQGQSVMAVAEFMTRHNGLSSRKAAQYMSEHFTEGALSHTTIAQHVALDSRLAAVILPALRTATVYGHARHCLAVSRYSWERWEELTEWQSLAAQTEDDAERSADAVRTLATLYSETRKADARESAATERKAQAAERKAERETKAAEAQAAVIAEAVAEATRGMAAVAEPGSVSDYACGLAWLSRLTTQLQSIASGAEAQPEWLGYGTLSDSLSLAAEALTAAMADASARKLAADILAEDERLAAEAERQAANAEALAQTERIKAEAGAQSVAAVATVTPRKAQPRKPATPRKAQPRKAQPVAA